MRRAIASLIVMLLCAATSYAAPDRSTLGDPAEMNIHPKSDVVRIRDIPALSGSKVVATLKKGQIVSVRPARTRAIDKHFWRAIESPVVGWFADDEARLRVPAPGQRSDAAPVVLASAAPVSGVGPVKSAAAAAPPITTAYAAPTIQAAQDKKTNLISIAFRDAPIQEVFQLLGQSERVNILLRKGVTGNVSVSLYDVPLGQAISVIADAAGYAVEQPMPGSFVVLDRKDAGLDIAQGNTQVRTYKVQYSNPKFVADILTKHLSRYGKITPLLERSMLVIEDLPDFQQRIGQILREVDQEPKQILIEAKILEITLDETESFGVDWKKIFSADGFNNVGTQGLAAPGTPGLFFNFVNQNISLFLSALNSKGRVNTLSTPKLMALENQEASVTIGDRIGYKVTTTINLVTQESIQFLETGVILRVTPSVDHQGRILMRIHPEVSSGSISAGVPSKKSTEVTTNLLAEDGQSILIGGLIKKSTNVAKNGVPVLGDVPLIGWLFGNKDQGVHTSETVVLITPRIIRQPTDSTIGLNKLERSEDTLIRQTDDLGNRVPLTDLEKRPRWNKGMPE